MPLSVSQLPLKLAYGAGCSLMDPSPLSGFTTAASPALLATPALWAPGANRAVYTPYLFDQQFTIKKLAIYVGAAAGNVDVGIYSAGSSGPASKLTSSGTTAAAGTNAFQVFEVADVTLAPGLYYFGMVASDAATFTTNRTAPGINTCRALGVTNSAEGSALLPSTPTNAAPNASFAPAIYFTSDTIF